MSRKRSASVRSLVAAALLAVAVLGAPSILPPDVTPVTRGGANLPPVAEAGPDRVAEVREVLTFDASQSYDPDGSRAWRTLNPLPVPARSAAVAVLDGSIYVVGGTRLLDDGTRVFDRDVWRYDPPSDRWTATATLPKAKSPACGGSWGGRVYVAGGASRVGGEVTGHLTFVYDAAGDAWGRGADGPPSAPCWTGRMPVVGGAFHVLDETNGFHHRYDPEGDAWSSLPIVPRPREFFAVDSDEERVYKVGLEPLTAPPGTPGTLHVFDPGTGAWEERTGPPFGVHNAGVVWLDGELHVVGGSFWFHWTQDHHQVYDPRTDAWRLEDPLPTARDLLMAVAVGDFLYAIGGSGTNSVPTYDVVEAWGPWTEYRWDFGDGATAGEKVAAHAYDAPGTYVVTLTVTDADGGVGVDTATVTVRSPALRAEVDCDPDTLNRKSNGRWIACTVELPAGHDPRDIDPSTVRLATVPAVQDPKYGFARDPSSLGDRDGDGVEERMFKFARDAVQARLGPGVHELLLSGDLLDGTRFEGTVVLRVIH